MDPALVQALRHSCTEKSTSGQTTATSSTERVGGSYSITIIDLRSRTRTTYNLGAQDPPRSVRFEHHIEFALRVAHMDRRVSLDHLVFAGGFDFNILLKPTFKDPALKPYYEYTIGPENLLRWQLVRRFLSDQSEIADQILRRTNQTRRYDITLPDALECDGTMLLEVERLVGQNDAFVPTIFYATRIFLERMSLKGT